MRRPLVQLAELLASAQSECERAHAGLIAAEPSEIESATGRLQSVVMEAKVLIDAIQRSLSAPDSLNSQHYSEQDIRAFRESVAGLAQASATQGGVLNVLVQIGQQLLQSISQSQGATYTASGRANTTRPEGLQLQEQA